MSERGAKRKRTRRIGRRLERMVLGAFMAIAAFVIERRVLKAIKSGSVKPVADAEPKAPGLTAAPGEVADQPQR